MYQNRFEVGELLSARLSQYKDDLNAFVLAIPNGGVICGYEVAKNLNLPIQIELINTIFHPDTSTVIGHVTPDGALHENHFDLTQTFIDVEVERIHQLQQQSQELYFGERKWISVVNRTVILIDDGVETGQTISASIKMLKHHGAKKIVLGIPFAPIGVIQLLEKQVDDIFCLHVSKYPVKIASYYKNFHTVKHGTLMRLLAHRDWET